MPDNSPAPQTGNTLAYPRPSVAWYATIVLAILYWLSILDRFIIALLVDPIKRDMGISDVQFGMLHGIAFAITFSVFGLFAGAFADRFSRRWIIFSSVFIWSLATAFCGIVVHYWQLLIARVGVGAGEAGLNPSATSILSDLFPRDRLTTAMAVYTIGATIGSGTAYLFGGAIVDAVTHTSHYDIPLLGTLRSWQAVFLIIGIPGIAASLIIFTIPEPQRREYSSVENTGVVNDTLKAYAKLLQHMRSQWRFFAHHYAGFGLGATVMGGCAIWYPAHMGRTFALSPSEIGLYLGLTVIAASITGKLLCGYMVDTMYKKGYRDAQFRWYACCLLIAAPVGIVMLSTDQLWLFLVGVSIFVLLMAPLPACYCAALNLATPNEMRGTGIALFSGTAGLVAMASGPILIAAISDHFFDSIGMGMATAIAVCCPLAALTLAKGCRAMRIAVTEFEQKLVAVD